jgi:hypothetical protein
LNCIARNVGQLARRERLNILTRLQGKTSLRHLNDLAGYERLASTPPLAEMVDAWQQMVDPFLDTLTTQRVVMAVATEDRGVRNTPGVTGRAWSSNESSLVTGTTGREQSDAGSARAYRPAGVRRRKRARGTLSPPLIRASEAKKRRSAQWPRLLRRIDGRRGIAHQIARRAAS